MCCLLPRLFILPPLRPGAPIQIAHNLQVVSTQNVHARRSKNRHKMMIPTQLVKARSLLSRYAVRSVYTRGAGLAAIDGVEVFHAAKVHFLLRPQSKGESLFRVCLLLSIPTLPFLYPQPRNSRSRKPLPRSLYLLRRGSLSAENLPTTCWKSTGTQNKAGARPGLPPTESFHSLQQPWSSTTRLSASRA